MGSAKKEARRDSTGSSPLKKAKEAHRERDVQAASAQAAGLVGSEPSVAAQGVVACRHIPTLVNFLKMFHIVARALRWSPSCTPSCGHCRTMGEPLYACLQCPTFSCWSGDVNHFALHNTDVGHAMAVECSTGVLYCFVCKVFIWNDHLQAIWQHAQRSSSARCMYIDRLETIVPAHSVSSSGHAPSGGGADAGGPPEASPTLTSLGAIPSSKDAKRHCVTARGLYNLGNTCFMNSVLQIMLHNVYLRRYFLAPEGPLHEPSECIRGKGGDGKTFCITCELDSLFSRMNDGTTSPVAPHRLLEGLWRSSRDMAGYDQQDAHELFVALRETMHSHMNGSIYNCRCIVHEIFSGVLQSDVTCLECGAVTETFDPFLDISLDVPLVSGGGGVLLEECLANFTREEVLQCDGYICETCSSGQAEISKRLCIRSHPRILAIHLKRFEHGASAAKVDTPVMFPHDFSLAPYMAENVVGSTNLRHFSYHLFGVICHYGNMEGGHYTSYICGQGTWFHIDDALVTLSEGGHVNNKNAYMLFYCREETDA